MPPTPPPVVPSTEIDFASQDLTPAFLSQWDGLRAVIGGAEVRQPVHFPALVEPQLVVHLRGRIHLEAHLSRHFSSAMTPGNFSIVPPGQAGTWFPKGLFETLVLFFDPLLFYQIALEALDHDPVHFELLEQIGVQDGLVYHIGLAIAQEMESGGVAGSLYIESLTHTLAVHLFRHYTVFPPTPPKLRGQLAPATLKQVQEYVEANLHGRLTLAEIAGVAHLSPYHFARLFKRTTGQTVHQFVLHRRILMGRRLLESGELSIAEIAEGLGFADASHFGQHFKRIVGVSPSQIHSRKKNS